MTLPTYWPVLAMAVPLAGTGLIAWGRLNARQDNLEKTVETKASKEIVERVEQRLETMDTKLDRLLEK